MHATCCHRQQVACITTYTRNCGNGDKSLQIMRLPRQLPGELDLDEVNRQLRAGEVCLDWTDVEPGIDGEQLARLCAGLNLAEHIDVIGSETISESLMPTIMAVFANVESNGDEATDMESLNGNESNPGEAPAIWLPENERDNESESEESEPAAPVMPHPEVLTLPSPAAMRAELEEMVLRDLLGPAGGPEEGVGDDRGQARYLVGRRAPPKLNTIPERKGVL